MPATPATRATRAYLTGWARGWHLPDRLSVWQWADQYRKLQSETSKEPGQWRTDRNPPARAIMESLSPHSGAEIVTVCAGVQTVKTESANNLIGYTIAHAPGPIIICQPTQVLGNDWKLMRFDAMAASTPTIQERLTKSKQRDSANTLSRVKFPGGWLIVSHAASASSLGMYSALIVIADEVDSYEELRGGEGDPLMTLRRRTDSFGRRRKVFQCSSPKKLMGASLIWREYLLGDQRQYWVPCPRCDTAQILTMDQILPTGEYLCESCAAAIPHSAKTDMLAAGDWRAEHPERTVHHSYRLPSLYSPVGLGRTWKELHDERQAAGTDPALVKAFVSTSLAIPYEPPGTIDAAAMQRTAAESWTQRAPPPACLLLVAFTDVQGDRLETLLMGFGRGPSPRDPQVYVVDYHITHGRPIEPETWADLETYLDTPILNAWGQPLVYRLHGVDSGNWAHEVYAECAARVAKGWIPTKGDSESKSRAPLIGPPRLHDFNWRGRLVKHGGAHHMIGTTTAKDTLLDRLAILPTQAPLERWWHLPSDLPATWYAGMVAERRDPETSRWVKTVGSARNEPIDTAVGCWALAHLTGSVYLPRARRVAIHTWSARDWDHLEQAMCPLQGDLFAPPPVAVAAPTPRPPVSRETPVPPVRAPRAPSPPPTGFGKEGWGL